MKERFGNSRPIQAADDEISLKELFQRIVLLRKYLFSQWRILIIIGFLGAVVGLLVSILKKPTYLAETSFVLDDQKNSGRMMGAYSGLASQFGVNLGGVEGQGLYTGDNIMEFFKSRRMIQRTLLTAVEHEGKKETLADWYVDINEINKDWKKNPALANFRFSPDSVGNFRQDSLLKALYKSILKDELAIEKPDKKLSIIQLSIETEDELFSLFFSDQLVKNVSEDYIQSVTKKSSENLAVLTKMVDSVRNELNQAIGGVAIAAQENPNVNPALASLRVPSQKRTIDVQANTAIFNELVKQRELARMTLRNDKPLIQILDKPILPLEKNKIGKMKGMLVGGFIFLFIAIGYLIVRQFIRELTKRTEL